MSLREPTDRLARLVRLPERLRGPVVHAGGGAKGHLQFQEVAFVPGAELDGQMAALGILRGSYDAPVGADEAEPVRLLGGVDPVEIVGILAARHLPHRAAVADDDAADRGLAVAEHLRDGARAVAGPVEGGDDVGVALGI